MRAGFLVRTLTAFVTATAMLAAGASVASAASAAEPTTDTAASVEPLVLSGSRISQIPQSEIAAAFAELKASDLPRTTEFVDGRLMTTFTLHGIDFSFESGPSSPVRSGTSINPLLGGGWDYKGMYVSFNALDQQALIAGGAAALGIAICLIPAVGQIACGVVAVIITVATVYVANHGICSNKRTLRVYPTSRTGRCV